MHRSHDCPPTPPGAKHLASPVALANALSAHAKAEGVEGCTFDPMAMGKAGARQICLADAPGLRLEDGQLKDGRHLVEHVEQSPAGQLKVHWLGYAASSAEWPGFLNGNPRNKAICAAMNARERDATAAPDPEEDALGGRPPAPRGARQVRHEMTRHAPKTSKPLPRAPSLSFEAALESGQARPPPAPPSRAPPRGIRKGSQGIAEPGEDGMVQHLEDQLGDCLS